MFDKAKVSVYNMLMSERLNSGIIDEDKFFSTDRAWKGTKAGAIVGLAAYGVRLGIAELVTRGEIIRSVLDRPLENMVAIAVVGAGLTLLGSSMGTLIEAFRPTSRIVHRFIQEEIEMFQDLGILPKKD